MRAHGRGRRRWLLAVAGSIGVAAFALNATGGAAAPTCSLYWTGAAGSDWAQAFNWAYTDGGPSGARVPNSSDYVCMSTAPVSAAALVNGAASVGAINWPSTSTVKPNVTTRGGGLTTGSANP